MIVFKVTDSCVYAQCIVTQLKNKSSGAVVRVPKAPGRIQQLGLLRVNKHIGKFCILEHIWRYYTLMRFLNYCPYPFTTFVYTTREHQPVHNYQRR